MLHAFFYKQHHAEIWFEVKTIRYQKEFKGKLQKKDLLSEEHYWYKFHALLIKSSVYSHLIPSKIVPEIERMMDVISIFHFKLFFALLPP